MELGPFKYPIKKTYDVDFWNLDAIDLIDPQTKAQNDSAKELFGDDVVSGLGYEIDSVVTPSDDRYLLGINLEIEWDMSINADKTGIWNMDAVFTRATGVITVEELPYGADPKDEDVELIEYEVDFDTDAMKFECKIDKDSFRDFKIGMGEIYPKTLEVDFKDKTAILYFK